MQTRMWRAVAMSMESRIAVVSPVSRFIRFLTCAAASSRQHRLRRRQPSRHFKVRFHIFSQWQHVFSYRSLKTWQMLNHPTPYTFSLNGFLFICPSLHFMICCCAVCFRSSVCFLAESVCLCAKLQIISSCV